MATNPGNIGQYKVSTVGGSYKSNNWPKSGSHKQGSYRNWSKTSSSFSNQLHKSLNKMSGSK